MTSYAKHDWVALAQKISPRTEAFINGKFQPSASGRTFDSINPATGQVLGQVAACGAEDVDRAVASARTAFESGVWSRAAPSERKAVLLRLADLLRTHLDELALLESLDMGKLVVDARTYDVPGSADLFQWYGEAVDKIYDEVAPTDPGNLALVRRQPLGVIGAVVPWNYPLNIATWKCGPALAAGNSVVLKPAEQSPLTALRLAELAMEAGLPAGVLNVVPGTGPETGRALGLHMDVDCLAFTGSTAVGKAFLGYAAQSNMKQVWLECGGKSPNLVFEDVEDIDTAAEMAAFGIFFNQGEICSANSRLLVQNSIKDEFIEKLKEKAAGFRPGNPLDPDSTMGAIVDARHTARIEGAIKAARETSRLVLGGERMTIDGGDCFIEPTIFVDVDPKDPLSRDEIFGPVLAVTGFDDEAEAVTLANDTIYGLAASVWTSKISRAHRVAEALKVGTVSVNTVDAFSAQTPFGGVKQSGMGRDLSLHALDKYTALKTTWIKF
ncbi:aldehyde dehydrogenase [Hyphomicrobium sp. 99]|uniref:aldehyde dehydrogenase n=1 Tax=Hyphomicrobium sp. 99 TaxID=1163419 RepID=UPI0005F799BF|nr:aldehyde dehydrogenase [Hyphomicrobium sp. 99]